MTKQSARAHLRLVPTSISTEKPHAAHAAEGAALEVRALVKSVHLPFSNETLHLRMEPCVCGGAYLYYVKIVDLQYLADHKPVLRVSGNTAEEIVLSHHVIYRKLHRFFGISPVSLVFKHVLKLRRKLLQRDRGLEQSVRVKQYFEDAFGI